MKTIGAFDAKTHLSQYLTAVEQHGEGIVIQRRGKCVAVLEPYEQVAGEQTRATASRILEALREIRETDAVAGTAAATKELVSAGRKR